MKRENEFDKLLLKSIDNSPKEIFAENAAISIYTYLESNYALGPVEIPEKLDIFVERLYNSLSTGAFAAESI